MIIGILFVNILLGAIFILTLIALVLFIISMILFLKNKIAQKAGKTSKKTGAIVTLVISIIFSLPMLILLVASSIFSIIQNEKEKAVIESIENKVIVEDEWKKGFEYDGKNLVPVNLFINSDNYDYDDNLTGIGVLVIENTNNYHSLYELASDSGYKIYYVHVSEFVGGEYYSRTFVDENDYDSVLEYYNTAHFEVSAMWRTAPEETKLNNIGKSLDLNIDDNRDDLIELSHEVLDNIPNKDKESVNPLYENYEISMEFWIKSSDNVFTIHLVIYTKQNEMRLYLNDYEAEEKIVEKHRDMLLHLMDESQKELLDKVEEIP